MTDPDRRTRLALALIWVTPALWTVNSIVARWAPGVVDPHTLALGRWAIAGALLAFLARAELWRERRTVLAAWPQHLVLGALGMLICGAWVYLGAQTTQAINISLIYSAAPVAIALGAVLWLGERFSPRQAAGVVLALVGVLHVVVRGQWTALTQVQWVVGDAWMLLAMLAWAVYALLLRHWATPLSATARLAAISAGGVLILLPFSVFEFLQPDRPAWTAQATWLVLAAALLPGFGAYLAHGWSQRVLGASRVAVSLYLGPLYTAVAAWGILHEPLGLHHLVGAAFILPGIYLVSRGPAA
jgi:drug/metabolite transporter (DMT)-like permease